ncbi:MAG TPA: polyprenol phosphomannose-dependent alpha 1,6 mannosyltransferase MptB [Chloroflexota bacterium]|nr:polyprenol phosphomannose-dependent alpha 1,6 mannosyltransferase MptB [Chloroflexota bacterium]
MSPFTRFRAPASGRFFHRQYMALFGLALLSLAGYVLMAFWFPLAPAYRQVPLADIRDFTPSLTTGMAYGLLLMVLYGLYWQAFRLTQRVQPRLAFVLGTAVLFSLPLLFTYPINASDVFRYLIHGRITAFYHTNPYQTPPNTFPQDPSLACEWAGETSPYGPVWELGAAAIARLAGNDLYAGLLLLKLLGLAAFLLCGWLLWRLLAHAPPARRMGLTLLWVWNPALLLMFVVDAHNDALMLLWLLAGYWLRRQGYPVVGLIIMFLAVLTKPIALLPWAFFFLAAWRGAPEGVPEGAARGRLVWLTAVPPLLLTFVAFLPFGSPVSLVSRLAREAANYPGFSPITLILLFIPEWGTLTMAQYNLIVNIGRLAFLLLAGWLAWQTWHGRNPLRAAADIFFGYLFTAPAFRIWYAAWPFPWLLLDEGERGDTAVSYRLRVGLWFLLTTQLSVIIYSHLHHYRLDEASLPTHLIGVPFTFGLPFLLAAVAARKPHSDAPQTEK